MEFCGATWYKDGQYYVCQKLKNHSDFHSYTYSMNWTSGSTYALPDYKSLYDNAIVNSESYRLANIELNTKLKELEESKQSWVDRYYRRNAEKEELDNTVNDLETKIANQAKSLTEMHARIERDKKRINSHANLETWAVKKENDSLRKELKDLRENFTYNEKSWAESNELLKQRIHHLNSEVTALQKEDKVRYRSLQEKIAKWEEWWKQVNAAIGFNPTDGS